MSSVKKTALFHLPGLFEFYDFYKVFLDVYDSNREYFYDWVSIASIYGAPDGCIWAGGRFEACENTVEDVFALLQQHNISARLTFSNSLLSNEHLSDRRCNDLCRIFEKADGCQTGIIIYSDILLEYLMREYNNFYYISSTTKVLTGFEQLKAELSRSEFSYVVPDFRFNNQLAKLNTLTQTEKDKIEFLCNECCDPGCVSRKVCYENVSRRILGEDCEEHICQATGGEQGYLFSRAMESPLFIGRDDIRDVYLENGFSNYKIEGRGLGSAVVLEMLLYYMVRPEYQLKVREKIYLDSMLNLF